MAHTKVPEKHHEGLKKILALSDNAFKELIKAVSVMSVKIYPEDGLLEAITKVRDISSEDAEIMANAVLSLCINRGSSEKETAAYLDDLQSLEKSLTLTKEEWALLKDRLIKVLDIKPLLIATKATGILFEYERIFGKVRVLTDVRPVFDTKQQASPQASIIVHTLNIHYQQDGAHKEFFVALDDDDIQTFLATLERAKAKSKSLKQSLENTNLKCI